MCLDATYNSPHSTVHKATVCITQIYINVSPYKLPRVTLNNTTTNMFKRACTYVHILCVWCEQTVPQVREGHSHSAHRSSGVNWCRGEDISTQHMYNDGLGMRPSALLQRKVVHEPCNIVSTCGIHHNPPHKPP